LYTASKNYKKKEDKTREEIEFEQQREELTFAPRILKSSASKYLQKECLTTRGTEETIERLHRARKVIVMI
jgi:hypothetical protein